MVFLCYNIEKCIKGRLMMTGMERFVFDGKDVGFNFLDFWRFKYSNIYSLHGAIAEFIVSKALGLNQSQNKTISLGRIKGLGYSAKRYDEIRAEIDTIIDTM